MKIRVMWSGLVEVEANTYNEALMNVVLDRNLMEANTYISAAANGATFSPEKNTLDHLKMNYAKEVLK